MLSHIICMCLHVCLKLHENKHSQTPFLHIWVHLRRVFPAGSPDSYFYNRIKSEIKKVTKNYTKQRHHRERVLLKIRRKREQVTTVRSTLCVAAFQALVPSFYCERATGSLE